MGDEAKLPSGAQYGQARDTDTSPVDVAAPKGAAYGKPTTSEERLPQGAQYGQPRTSGGSTSTADSTTSNPLLPEEDSKPYGFGTAPENAAGHLIKAVIPRANPSDEPYGFGTALENAAGNTIKRFGQGAYEGLGNIAQTAYGAAKDLATPDEGLQWKDLLHPSTWIPKLQNDPLLNKYVLAPAAAEGEKARQEAQQYHESTGIPAVGHAASSMAHTAAEFLPVIGPIASHIGERAGTGDIAGAAGEGAAYVGAPKLAEKALPKAASIYTKIHAPWVRDIISYNDPEPYRTSIRSTNVPQNPAFESAIKYSGPERRAPIQEPYSQPERRVAPNKSETTNTASPTTASPKSISTDLISGPEEGWGGPSNVREMKPEALRHALGDQVVDAFASTKEGLAALKQLGNGTYANYADIANYEGIVKPKALSARTGPEWTSEDFKRTVAEHGKELNPTKELVARHLADRYNPADIMRRTEGWGKVTKSPSGGSQGADEYTGEERRSNPRNKPLSATELEDSIKQRRLIQTPFDVTQGARSTIERDSAMPRVSGGSQSATVEGTPEGPKPPLDASGNLRRFYQPSGLPKIKGPWASPIAAGRISPELLKAYIAPEGGQGLIKEKAEPFAGIGLDTAGERTRGSVTAPRAIPERVGPPEELLTAKNPTPPARELIPTGPQESPEEFLARLRRERTGAGNVGNVSQQIGKGNVIGPAIGGASEGNVDLRTGELIPRKGPSLPSYPPSMLSAETATQGVRRAPDLIPEEKVAQVYDPKNKTWAERPEPLPEGEPQYPVRLPSISGDAGEPANFTKEELAKRAALSRAAKATEKARNRLGVVPEQAPKQVAIDQQLKEAEAERDAADQARTDAGKDKAAYDKANKRYTDAKKRITALNKGKLPLGTLEGMGVPEGPLTLDVATSRMTLAQRRAALRRAGDAMLEGVK